MAEHTIETRILLRYATYTQWMNSRVILKQGEAAIATFPNQRVIDYLSNSTPDNTPPAIGIKIGDGQHYFYELPWVQAIAADVYSWAKTPDKPTYSAVEISGLKTYIQNNAPTMPGDGTVAPRVYQIVRGTGVDNDKYYLQYKESTDNDNWITDTNHYIDLEKLFKILNWIKEENIDEYPYLTALTGIQTYNILADLTSVDNAVTNQFVTSVSQSNGAVSVTRARPSFTNISGTATVSQGGTGRTTLALGEVLIGNETGGILSRPIAEEIAMNTHLVPNYLIKQYVDNAVAGLEGAMHFWGEATEEPKNAADPKVPEHPFNTVRPGDVVLWEQKEYVWTGASWRLLGDEGSYAVKGSIRDADIDDEANIKQSKILNLAETFATKVDKEEGKGLSSNDYTTEEKLKLASIQEGAQVNIINGITLNTRTQVPDNDGIVNLIVKEFSDEDKNKLDSIQTGAQVNIIESIYLNGTQVPANQNKRVDLNIRQYPLADENKLATIAEGAQANVIEHIKVNGTEVPPDQSKTVSILLDPHTEHINKIEAITINGTNYPPDNNKTVNITLDSAALNLSVIEGAIVPNDQGGTDEISILNKKLYLSAIAKNGDVKYLTQTQDTYIVLDCGTSESDSHS